MYIIGYPIIKSTDKDFDYNAFKIFQKDLENKLDCKIISNFSDYIYDRELFFDSNVHLTTEGAEIRTKQFINDFKKNILENNFEKEF